MPTISGKIRFLLLLWKKPCGMLLKQSFAEQDLVKSKHRSFAKDWKKPV